MKLGIITDHDRNGIMRVRELGLDYAEFDVNGDDVTYLTDNPSAIQTALSDYNVKLGAVGRWGRDRIKKDGSFNEKEQADEFGLIDFCVQTSCPVYICGVNYVNELSYFQNITAAVGYIDSLLQYAAGRVKICTYNCSWNNYIDKPHEWDIVHSHLKGLGIKFDPSHTINGGRNYLSEAVSYADRFYHVHLKGTINVDGVHVDDPPAGLDTINWGAFLSILHKHKYNGMLSIEPHSETWQGELGDKGLRFTIEYIKKLLFM